MRAFHPKAQALVVSNKGQTESLGKHILFKKMDIM